ncbi:MAG: dihydrofolate reductase family protein [Anaerolineae bacterium]|nr:dihydrofolate reductase family protein [Anaerolineae bacterium]
MPKVTLYIAASLDGYIAQKDDGLDWLSLVEQPGQDYGYAEFYASVDCLVMGSSTFQLIRGFEPWPYPGKQTFVMTAQKLKSTRQDVAFLPANVDIALARIDSQGFKSIWLVGGGALTSSFARQVLIDEYIISTIPILLGEGIPLFPPPGGVGQLELLNVQHFPSGLVQSHYRRSTDV